MIVEAIHDYKKRWFKSKWLKCELTTMQISRFLGFLDDAGLITKWSKCRHNRLYEVNFDNLDEAIEICKNRMEVIR